MFPTAKPKDAQAIACIPEIEFTAVRNALCLKNACCVLVTQSDL